MKMIKIIFLALFLVSLFAITVASQIPKTRISIEEIKACSTIFFDEVKEVYGNCIHYHNYTSCLNSTGPNTACSLKQDAINFRCKIKEITIKNNRTECKPQNKLVISIDKGVNTAKHEIDFSQWGSCIYNSENNCLIVTCQSIYDGANDGNFHGCGGGTSCQRFEICKDSIRTFYKNSRSDFAEYDPTFHLPKLEVNGVGK